MRIGIDASNLRSGGGLTHLGELLDAAEPRDAGVDRVVVWGGRSTLEALPAAKPWLEKAHEPVLDRSLGSRLAWAARGRLRRLAEGCAVLFVPGGFYPGTFRPFVTMARNMLPFDWAEMRRYAPSSVFFRLLALRVAQGRTFRKAAGIIFMTEYARSAVLGRVGPVGGAVHVIPHGVADRFRCSPRGGSSPGSRAVRVLYVSIVDLYKHQWHVAEATAQLRKEGLPIELDLVGPAYPPALSRLRHCLDRIDPSGSFARYRGPVAFEDLPAAYRDADVFVFASTCENMPNILLEAMASGLPIVCSNRGPMPEVLGPAGVYCDPENPSDIARALREVVTDPARRGEHARRAHHRAGSFSWDRCARDTFAFLARVAGGLL